MAVALEGDNERIVAAAKGAPFDLDQHVRAEAALELHRSDHAAGVRVDNRPGEDFGVLNVVEGDPGAGEGVVLEDGDRREGKVAVVIEILADDPEIDPAPADVEEGVLEPCDAGDKRIAALIDAGGLKLQEPWAAGVLQVDPALNALLIERRQRLTVRGRQQERIAARAVKNMKSPNRFA